MYKEEHSSFSYVPMAVGISVGLALTYEGRHIISSIFEGAVLCAVIAIFTSIVFTVAKHVFVIAPRERKALGELHPSPPYSPPNPRESVFSRRRIVADVKVFGLICVGVGGFMALIFFATWLTALHR